MRAWLSNPVARRVALACAFALWFTGVGWGMKLVLDYQAAPGAPAAAPATWPTSSSLAHPAGRPTLVLLLHPRCPCSRATLTELSRIVTHAQGQLAVEVLFVVPAGLDAKWAESELWRMANAIPGIHITVDPNGREARNFGAATSGQALFYDTAGRLEFAGGLTPGRGHEGDNAGEAAVEALVLGARTASVVTGSPVFGCAFASPIKAAMINPAPVCPK